MAPGRAHRGAHVGDVLMGGPVFGVQSSKGGGESTREGGGVWGNQGVVKFWGVE